MSVAIEIHDSIKAAGVLSSVGFRERYRPIFQRAKDFLSDKTVVHCQFVHAEELPRPNPPPRTGSPSRIPKPKRDAARA